MIEQSEAIGELSKALVAAQADFPTVEKSSTNPHFKNRYADLTTIIETVRPVLKTHGLAVMQFQCLVNGEDALTTRVMHSSGEWMQSTARVAVSTRNASANAQEVGSALTYARRYGISAALGLVADDDDGHQAANRQTPARTAGTPRPSGDVTPPRHDAGADRSGNHPEPGSVPPASGPVISEAQVQRLWVIARANRIPDEQVKAAIQIVAGVESSKAIPKAKYDEVISVLGASQEARS